jgi:hypothetical protein
MSSNGASAEQLAFRPVVPMAGNFAFGGFSGKMVNA